MEAWGGGSLRLAYRLPGLGLPLEGEVDLKALALALTSPEGEGALRYAGGKVEGRLVLGVYGLALALEGKGDRVAVSGSHPAYPWWAAGAGRLEGEVDLSGTYRLAYAAGPQRLTLTGRLLEAVLEAEGPYASGRLTYPAGGDLRVDLPLPPLEGRFRGRVGGEGYGVEGVLEAGGGRVLVEGRLLPLRGELVLEEAALEDFVARYVPYLKGRVSGRVHLEGLKAQGALSGRVEVAGTALPFSFSGDLGAGLARGEGRLGETAFRVDLEGGRLDLFAAPRAFPLHLLLAAVAGPLEGEAYWTGVLRLRLPLGDPLRGEGVLVGESLRFVGAGTSSRAGRPSASRGAASGWTPSASRARAPGRGGATGAPREATSTSPSGTRSSPPSYRWCPPSSPTGPRARGPWSSGSPGRGSAWSFRASASAWGPWRASSPRASSP
ncbi:hypothetical protein [Thermus thermophilus]|uniref:Translocation/assembly module TamB n=1 Tax=Thermus thermophilus TaxID=274 RepID=A0A7R7TCL8_THETH|nr:hypothetical protein [Thermus thermophilus]BCP65642.1 hypothetical protein TthHB5018_05760 [Thermus thermophilus]